MSKSQSEFSKVSIYILVLSFLLLEGILVLLILIGYAIAMWLAVLYTTAIKCLHNFNLELLT